MSRILVADDYADTRDLMEIALEHLGHTVEVVNDGEAALRSIMDHRPDLAIIDVGMPKMSGVDVVKAIRANAETEDLPVILFTGRIGVEELAEDCGTDLFLTKPFTLSSLGLFVDDVLRRRTSRVS